LCIGGEIIADPKLEVLEPGEWTERPADIDIDQSRRGAILTRDLLTRVEIRRKPRLS
jgi:hypothetical protein